MAYIDINGFCVEIRRIKLGNIRRNTPYKAWEYYNYRLLNILRIGREELKVSTIFSHYFELYK